MPGVPDRWSDGRDTRFGSVGLEQGDDVILLTGLAAHGYHGVYQSERDMGQPFKVDLAMYVDLAAAAATDDLSMSVDYAQVAKQVVDLMAGQPVQLLETLAQRIADCVLADGRINAVEVTVHKPQAQLGVSCQDVAVRLLRHQGGTPSGGQSGLVEAGQVPFDLGDGPSSAPAPPMIDPWAVRADMPSWPTAMAGPPSQAPWSSSPGSPSRDASASLPAAGLSAASHAVHAEPEAVRPVGTATEEPASSPPRRRRAQSHALDQAPKVLTEAIVAMGANVGDALETLRSAVKDIDSEPGVQVVDASPLARTQAVGVSDQSDFFNGVLRVHTKLSARQLWRVLVGVERAHGRERTVQWGPRTLDLDLVTYGSLVATDAELTVPHPRAHRRAFVLLPWAQMAPRAQLPGPNGGPVAELADVAPDRPGVRWLAPNWLGTEHRPTKVTPAAPPVPWLKVLPSPPSTPPGGSTLVGGVDLAQAVGFP